LTLFKYNLIYKRWLVNALSLDMDVKNTIKQVTTSSVLTRTCSAPTVSEVIKHINDRYWCNDQGIVFQILKCKTRLNHIRYHGYQIEKNPNRIYFEYQTRFHCVYLYLCFDLSLTTYEKTHIRYHPTTITCS